jgi:hypothetical protein
MTARATLRQSDLERVMKAAKKAGLHVEFDLKRGVARTLTADQPETPMAPLDRWLAENDEDGDRAA